MLYQLSYTHRKKLSLTIKIDSFFQVFFLNLLDFGFTFKIDLPGRFDYYLLHIDEVKLKDLICMNALIIFTVRLILGLAFGIILTRLFRPDWGIYHGVGTGIFLVALAYGMSYFRKSKE